MSDDPRPAAPYPPPRALSTARLRIRPFVRDDAAFIVAMLNDPDWIRFIGQRNIASLDDARNYLDSGPIAMYAEHGLGLCAVERRDDRAVIGMCGLIRRPGLDAVDIGYALLPAARGQGFAEEAARAVLEHGSRELGIGRIVAILDPANVRSVRVLERIGMRQEGEVVLPSSDTPLALYATA